MKSYTSPLDQFERAVAVPSIASDDGIGQILTRVDLRTAPQMTAQMLNFAHYPNTFSKLLHSHQFQLSPRVRK